MFGTLLLLLHAALFSFSPWYCCWIIFVSFVYFFLLHLTGVSYSLGFFFHYLASDRSPICCAWLNVTKCENNRWHCFEIQRKSIQILLCSLLYTATHRILLLSFTEHINVHVCLCLCLCFYLSKNMLLHCLVQIFYFSLSLSSFTPIHALKPTKWD